MASPNRAPREAVASRAMAAASSTAAVKPAKSRLRVQSQAVPPMPSPIKTTRPLAATLATTLGFCHVELDGLWWDADWTEAGAEVFGRRAAEFGTGPR